MFHYVKDNLFSVTVKPRQFKVKQEESYKKDNFALDEAL